jgi:Photosynthetic reaction centre cytochrome C subunit
MPFRHFLLAICLLVLTAAASSAQTPAPAGGGQRAGGAPAPYQNLLVLPKDIPRDQLTEMMRGFNAALGVNCNHCHVFIAPGNAGNNMPSDEKTPKLVARVMMQMTNDINTRLAANIKKPADQITQVGCATCHRGAAIPVVPPPPPAAAGAPAPAK